MFGLFLRDEAWLKLLFTIHDVLGRWCEQHGIVNRFLMANISDAVFERFCDMLPRKLQQDDLYDTEKLGIGHVAALRHLRLLCRLEYYKDESTNACGCDIEGHADWTVSMALANAVLQIHNDTQMFIDVTIGRMNDLVEKLPDKNFQLHHCPNIDETAKNELQALVPQLIVSCEYARKLLKDDYSSVCAAEALCAANFAGHALDSRCGIDIQVSVFVAWANLRDLDKYPDYEYLAYSREIIELPAICYCYTRVKKLVESSERHCRDMFVLRLQRHIGIDKSKDRNCFKAAIHDATEAAKEIASADSSPEDGRQLALWQLGRVVRSNIDPMFSTQARELHESQVLHAYAAVVVPALGKHLCFESNNSKSNKGRAKPRCAKRQQGGPSKTRVHEQDVPTDAAAALVDSVEDIPRRSCESDDSHNGTVAHEVPWAEATRAEGCWDSDCPWHSDGPWSSWEMWTCSSSTSRTSSLPTASPTQNRATDVTQDEGSRKSSTSSCDDTVAHYESSTGATMEEAPWVSLGNSSEDGWKTTYSRNHCTRPSNRRAYNNQHSQHDSSTYVTAAASSRHWWYQSNWSHSYWSSTPAACQTSVVCCYR